MITLGLLSPTALALVLDNESLTIDASTPLDRYTLINQSVLTVDGARTTSIAVRDSRLDMRSGDTRVVSGPAINLVGGQATIGNAVIISNNGAGLVLAHAAGEGSSAVVRDSRIQGGTVAVQVNADGILDIADSQMTATAAGSHGMRLQGGSAQVTRSSIMGQGAGVFMTSEVARPSIATLRLDNSSVGSATGPGIDVRTRGSAVVDLRNGSAVSSGSGTAVQVASVSNLALSASDSSIDGNVSVLAGGVASLDLQRSRLIGDVQGAAGSDVTLVLADHSQMNGDIDNVRQVTVASASTLTGTLREVQTFSLEGDARFTGSASSVGQASIGMGAVWHMTDHSTVGDLAMQGGQVTFGDPGRFHNLTVTNLSGDGTFVMTNDFATGAGDQLIVTGKAEGNHGLLVGSSGQEASVDSLRLVQIQTQPQPGEPSAHFYLLNDRERVDVGAYSYELAEDENGWVLNRETRTVAPITMTAMALFNTPITVAYGELSSLRSRMGELRYSEGRNAGLWMRAYGNQYNVSGASQGAGYQQNQRGMSLGADMQLADSDWLVGVLAGSSRSDLNLDYGSSGTVDSYYVGGYATWLDRETGFYVDTVLKYNRYQNNAKVGMSDHTRSKGDYDTHGVSASVEAGKHIKLNDGYFIEPFVQVATAAVAGKDYTFDNGLRAEGDMAKSLLGKVGTTVGKTIPLDGGAMVQPYVKGAFAHEFAQRNQVQVNNNVFNNDLSGSRAELGAGVSLALSKQFRAHFEIESSYGKHIEQPYGVNVGVRYDF